MVLPVDRYPDPPVTPEKFERLVAALLGNSSPKLHGLRIQSHEVIDTPDGSYDFDATARFEAMGMDFLVLIEAKLHGRPVERADVQILHQKMQSTGAQKAVLASSSGFQRGAIDFAAAHGVALSASSTTAFCSRQRPRTHLPRRHLASWQEFRFGLPTREASASQP